MGQKERRPASRCHETPVEATAAAVACGLSDGSNATLKYADPKYTPVNESLIVKITGHDAGPEQVAASGARRDDRPERHTHPGPHPEVRRSQWGAVLPFAVDLLSVLPGPPPLLDDPDTDDDFKAEALNVIRLSSRLTPDATIGNDAYDKAVTYFTGTAIP